MADQIVTQPVAEADSGERLWHYDHPVSTHEDYEGSKQQLQSIGIGSGRAFPGERGAPPRAFTVSDAMGRRWQISKRGPGRFFASRKKPIAEREAAKRADQARSQLVYCVETREQFLRYAQMTLGLARKTLGYAGAIADGQPTAYRFSGEIQELVDEICEELLHLERRISCSDLVPDPKGQGEIQRLRRTLDLYEDAAFLKALQPQEPTARKSRASAHERGA